jgi:hypothetical protein
MQHATPLRGTAVVDFTISPNPPEHFSETTKSPPEHFSDTTKSTPEHSTQQHGGIQRCRRKAGDDVTQDRAAAQTWIELGFPGSASSKLNAGLW